MSTFETISENVLKWADDKNLLQEKNKLAQYMKFQEEAGELARGILKNDRAEIVDAIGDVLVTVCILAKQLDLDPVQCYNMAWHVIKERTGKTVGGTFIKD